MKIQYNDDNIQDFTPSKLYARASEVVSLRIPVDTLRSLERVAVSRDMSVDALLKF